MFIDKIKGLVINCTPEYVVVNKYKDGEPSLRDTWKWITKFINEYSKSRKILDENNNYKNIVQYLCSLTECHSPHLLNNKIKQIIEENRNY
jgi:hypothetical protein